MLIIASTPRRRLASAAVLVLLGALAALGTPAYATIRHLPEGSFTGSPVLSFALAVDDSSGPGKGSVYVGEFGTVTKLNASGEPTGVTITGAETPQGSFSLINSENLAISRIAVDGSSTANSGDVYVADVEHGVVDRFDEAGKFLCQITGRTPASPEEIANECAGATGSATPNGSIEPTGLAVDSSTGDLYVADLADEGIDRFSPAGKYLGQITDSHITSPGDIALDSNGNLYVQNSPGFGVFFGSTANSVVQLHNGGFERLVSEHGAAAVAVDQADGHVYIAESSAATFNNVVSEYDSAGVFLDTVGRSRETNFESVGVSSSGRVYAAEIGGAAASPEVHVFSPDVVVPTVTTGPASAVTETSAVLSGRVDPDAADGGGPVTGCHFEYVTDNEFQAHPGNRYEGAQTVTCAPSVPYSVPTNVSAQVTLAPSTKYHYRVAANNSNEVVEVGEDEVVFTPGLPAVESETVSSLAPGTVTVTANINPRGFEATCDEVQYVDQTRFEQSGYSEAKSVPCSPSHLGSGFTAQSTDAVLSGLQISSTYHFRFVVSNSVGATDGADSTFSTFGIRGFQFEVLDREGQPYTQAGGHPYAWNVAFQLNPPPAGAQQGVVANVKNVQTELPSGLLANPIASARCTPSELTLGQCSAASQVGVFKVADALGERYEGGIYNVVPPPGVPVRFGALVENLVRLYIDGNVRTGGDYGATARVINSSEEDGIASATITLWGVPADSSHDALRRCPVPGKLAGETPCASGQPLRPFLTNPTSCSGPQTASIEIDSWQAPGQFATATSTLPGNTGCGALDFTPALSVRPDTTVADSPSGLHVDLKIPQSENPVGLAEADLKQAIVTLPRGMSVSPSAASGLQACSPAEIGLGNANAPECPAASKIGNVEVISPLLSDHLTGGVFVAEQGNNPFGSLLAIYVTAEADGAVVKLAGHVVADPVTGQLTTTFDNNPQLPFSELKLDFFGGPRAALATPETCGIQEPGVSSSLTPWSGSQAIDISEPFAVDSGCVNGFAPTFAAGTSSPLAGVSTPFLLSFSRADTDQEISGLSVALPPGLLAKIAGVPLCPDAQASAGTCPEASQVGTVRAGAGPGSEPFFLPGRAYLTGPYKGAPYGLVVVVPAVAGPFNLGTVVVRQALYVDRVDAHATAVSDPFPTILQGIPIRLRRVDVLIERPGFTFNPTSCAPLTVSGSILSVAGVSDAVSAPFQVTGCRELPLKPTFTLATRGPGSKADGASFVVKVKTAQGPASSATAHTEANIRKVEVQLPKRLPSRLSTLQKACTEQQFTKNPAGCPSGSLVGHAIAHSPVLPDPLQGPAYLVSHGGAAFPDLVLVLQADNVTIELTGHTQIKHGITYSRFETVPDAPVSSFELKLPAGRASLLAAYGNLCSKKVATTLKAPTTIVGQNGAVLKQDTAISVEGCPRATHHKTRARHRSRGRKS